MTLRTSGFALLILGVLSGPAVPAAAADRVDFTGTWLLDEDRSDDPVSKMNETMDERQRLMHVSEGQGPMTGGGMPPPGAMGGGRDEGEPDREKIRERLEKLNERFAMMTVTHEGEKLIVRYADGHERVMITDGKKHYREAGIGDLETRTKWKSDGVLIVKATAENGRKITETWELAPGGGFLHIKVSMKGHGWQPPINFTRVYELE
jgi:hypothetical protein